MTRLARLLLAILAALAVVDAWRWLRGNPVPAVDIWREPFGDC